MDRVNLLSNGFNLNFGLNKHEHSANPGDVQKKNDRFVLYDLTKEDLDGDCRPQKILRQELEDKFYDNIPF